MKLSKAIRTTKTLIIAIKYQFCNPCYKKVKVKVKLRFSVPSARIAEIEQT